MEKIFKFRTQLEYIRFLIQKNTRFIFLMFLAMLILNPVMVITIKALSNANFGVTVVGYILNIVLVIISTYIVSYLMFSYQTTKRGLDLYHSLPMKKNSLFLTSFISGICIILIPFTLSWITGMIVNSILYQSSVLIALSWYGFTIIPIIALYSVIIFAQMNTGTVVDGILYSFILTGLPLLIYFVYLSYSNTMLLGFQTYYDGNILSMLSPAFCILLNSISTLEFNPTLFKLSIFWLVITIIFLFINMYLYRNRRSEKAEMPFTNIYFFPCISAVTAASFQLLAFCFIYSQSISSANLFQVETVIYPVLIGMLIFVVMSTIAKRTFKYVLKSMFEYIVIGIAVFACLIPIHLTKGFGYVEKLPASAVKVELEYYDSLGILQNINYYSNFRTVPFVFESEQELNYVMQFHKDIISLYKEFDYSKKNFSLNFGENGTTYNPYETFDLPHVSTYVQFKYTLKDNTEVKRAYYIPDVWLKGLEALSNSETAFKNKYSVLEGKPYDRIETITIHDNLRTNATDLTNQLDVETFAKAYKLDFLSMTPNDAFSSTYTYLGDVTIRACKKQYYGIDEKESYEYCNNFIIPIDDRNIETLAYLDEMEFTFPKSIMPEKVILFYPDQKDSRSPLYHYVLDASSYYTSAYQNLEQDSYTYSYLTDNQFKQIESYLIPTGISDVPTYSICHKTYDSYGNETTRIYLVNPEYYDRVNYIITNNELLFGTDYSSIINSLSTKIYIK